MLSSPILSGAAGSRIPQGQLDGAASPPIQPRQAASSIGWLKRRRKRRLSASAPNLADPDASRRPSGPCGPDAGRAPGAGRPGWRPRSRRAAGAARAIAQAAHGEEERLRLSFGRREADQRVPGGRGRPRCRRAGAAPPAAPPRSRGARRAPPGCRGRGGAPGGPGGRGWTANASPAEAGERSRREEGLEEISAVDHLRRV